MAMPLTMLELKAMSHFSTVKTKLVDRDALVAGLREVLGAIGIDNPIIEVYDTPQRLENSYAPSDVAHGNIIVRRGCIPRPDWRDGWSAIDIGFLYQDDCYQAVLDAWDIEHSAIGQHFQQSSNTNAFLNALQVAHNKAYVTAQYPVEQWAQGNWVTLPDGSLQTTLTQKVDLAMI
ncbi:MAG: hypothetical protein RLZZ511_3124 [Cyanobacteriota bacterium]